MKEQKTEEWPVDIAFEIATLEIVSWRLFEINKQSNLRWIIPEKCFCLKVKDFFKGF